MSSTAALGRQTGEAARWDLRRRAEGDESWWVVLSMWWVVMWFMGEPQQDFTTRNCNKLSSFEAAPVVATSPRRLLRRATSLRQMLRVQGCPKQNTASICISSCKILDFGRLGISVVPFRVFKLNLPGRPARSRGHSVQKSWASPCCRPCGPLDRNRSMDAPKLQQFCCVFSRKSVLKIMASLWWHSYQTISSYVFLIENSINLLLSS